MTDSLRETLHAAAADDVTQTFGTRGRDLLARGRARRRRRRTTGVSGIAVAAAVIAIAIGPNVRDAVSSGDDPEGPASRTDVDRRPAIDVPPDDGMPRFEQRRLLYEVAWDHFDRTGQQLRWLPSVDTSNGDLVGTDLGWQVPGEGGLGLVRLGIGSSATADSWLRAEALCGRRSTYDCEPRQLPDGSTAWVGQRGDLLGVAYRQPDGDGIWLVVNPEYPYAAHPEPVSRVGITVEDALGFVADDRLRYLGRLGS
jgi:hypothetical protein